jgi:hypothetical protein
MRASNLLRTRRIDHDCARAPIVLIIYSRTSRETNQKSTAGHNKTLPLQTASAGSLTHPFSFYQRVKVSSAGVCCGGSLFSALWKPIAGVCCGGYITIVRVDCGIIISIRLRVHLLLLCSGKRWILQPISWKRTLLRRLQPISWK